MVRSLPKSRRAQRPGFSLVELMIVVVVIAIISAFAMPMFTGNDSNRLRAAAQLLAADISYTQMESISKPDAPRSLIVAANGTGYRIAPTSTPDAPINDPVTNQAYLVTFGSGRAAHMPGVTLTLTDEGDDDTIAFGTMGELDQATAPTITLSLNGLQLTVTVDPITGEATIGEQITN